MNHDYAHCLDEDSKCPDSCFRKQLNEDLRKHPDAVPFGLTSWMRFREYGMCQIEGEEDDHR